MKNRSIELHDCYFFDCDECGREVAVQPAFLTIEQVLASEAPHADEEEIKMLKDLFESEGGRLLDKPEKVKCPHCKTEFSVEESY